MKSKISKSLVSKILCSIFLVALEIGSTSCGRAVKKEEQPQVAAPEEDYAPRLGARIVPMEPGFIPAVPMSAEPEHQRLLAQNNSVVFTDVVLVTQSKVKKNGKTVSEPDPLFLVWDRDALGSPIVNAFYTLQKKDALNRDSGTLQRKNAYLDRNNSRWFLPLLEIIKEFDNANEAETHWVTLELQLQDQRIAYIEIGMRVSGPLPAVQVTELGAESFSGTAIELARLPTRPKGWVFAAEKYFNPSERKLKLWLKTDASGFDVLQGLSYNHYEDAGWIDANRSHALNLTWIHAKNLFSLKNTGVFITRQSDEFQTTEQLDLTQDSWLQIDLGSKETVTIEWSATTVGSVPKCSFGNSASRTFSWAKDEVCTGSSSRSDYGKVCTIRTPAETKVVSEWWRSVGAVITGSSQRQVWLTESYAPKDTLEALDDAGIARMLIQDQGVPRLEQTGEVDGNWPNYGCDGIF